MGDRFFPEYRNWGRWRVLSGKFCYGCINDALLRIQSELRGKKSVKKEIIEVEISKKHKTAWLKI